MGNGSRVLSGGMVPKQARAMARALNAAADSAEASQRGGAR
jgi:hypothetical protein